MKKAWIENNYIRDIAPDNNPFAWYHPDIAKFYDTDVPDNAANGDGFKDGVLTKRPVVEPPPPVPLPRTWSQDSIRNNLTLTEKVKWDSETLPEIKTVKLEFTQPRLLADTTELLQFLVDSNIISQASMNKVLQ